MEDHSDKRAEGHTGSAAGTSVSAGGPCPTELSAQVFQIMWSAPAQMHLDMFVVWLLQNTPCTSCKGRLLLTCICACLPCAGIQTHASLAHPGARPCKHTVMFHLRNNHNYTYSQQNNLTGGCVTGRRQCNRNLDSLQILPEAASQERALLAMTASQSTDIKTSSQRVCCPTLHVSQKYAAWW